MKERKSPKDCLTSLSYYIINGYKTLLENKGEPQEGLVQFELGYFDQTIFCYFKAEKQKLSFHFGEVENPRVKLTSSLYHWLALAKKELHPVWGLITGKLKLKGDVKFFKQIFNHPFIYYSNHLEQDPPTNLEKNPSNILKSLKKVVVLNASPRGKRGYTQHYLKPFVQGIQKSEHVKLDEIVLAEKKINECYGCFQCWKNNDGFCIQKDDVNAIYDKIFEADLVIYAFPLYWDTVPALLKKLIERAFYLEHPYMIEGFNKTRHPRRAKNDQAYFIFSVCGFPEKKHFNSVKNYFKNVCHNAHSAFLGGIYRTACMYLPINPLYFEQYEETLNALKKLGEELVVKKTFNLALKKQIEKEVSYKDFRLHSNKFWEQAVEYKKEEFLQEI